MKKYIFFLTFTLFIAACSSSKTATPTSGSSSTASNTKGVPVMTFEKRHFDLGKVKKGDKRELTYHFTNKGDTTLEIELVTACHCTLLDYSTSPVPPKGKGIIKAIFDSSEKDKEETIQIDIILKNQDPKTGYPMVEQVSYHFDIIK